MVRAGPVACWSRSPASRSDEARPEPDQCRAPTAAPWWGVREALAPRIAREQLLYPSALDTLAAAMDQPHLAIAGLPCGLQIGVDHLLDLGRPKRVEVEVILDGEPHRCREGSIVVGLVHGSCYTTRVGPIRRSGIRAAVLEESDTEGAAMIRDAVHIPHVSTGSYPLREGCGVRPLVDGEPAFRRICEAVEAARSRVWITVAFIEPDVQLPDGRGSFFDVLDRAVAHDKTLGWEIPYTVCHGDTPDISAYLMFQF